MTTLEEELPAFADDLPWLRRFAATLARDGDEADDLVQETMVAAWREAPDSDQRSLRPWLATVMRNRRKMALRSEERRHRREDEAGHPGSRAPDPEADVQRLEILAILVDEMSRLAPEDQSLVVQRFFEGKSAAEIARALDVPAGTVRSRLHRSLRRLRSALDENYGDRKTWSAAVLVAPGLGETGAVAGAGGASAGKGAAWLGGAALSASVLGLGGVMAWQCADQPEAEPVVEAPAKVEAPSLTPREQWVDRRDRIRRALPVEAPDQGEGVDEFEPPSRLVVDYRSAVDACLRDLETEHVGALTISLTEIGAPEIGTVVDEVEVVETNFEDAEALECIVESMYGLVGDAPPMAYARRTSLTMGLGEPDAPASKKKQAVGFIAGAHIGEVRVCGQKAEPSAEGEVEFELVMGSDGLLSEATPGESSLPHEVVACIRTRVLGWRFPKRVFAEGDVLAYTFVLPVPGSAPGPVEPDAP